MIDMYKYALVTKQNVVDNIIIWDGEATWTPPENMQVINVENTQCEISWVYENGVFTAPLTTDQTA